MHQLVERGSYSYLFLLLADGAFWSPPVAVSLAHKPRELRVKLKLMYADVSL